MSLKGGYIMPHPPILIDDIGKEAIKDVKETYDSCCEIGKRISELRPQTIIVITPHGQIFDDAISIYMGEKAHGDMSRFGNPQISIEKSIDYILSQRIKDNLDDNNIFGVIIDEDSADMYDIDYGLDHGAFVPLYFIDKYYTDYKVVHINYGFMSGIRQYFAGRQIAKSIEEVGEDVVVIASGDLSHRLKDEGPYDYHPDGPIFDNTLLKLLEKGDVKGLLTMDPGLISNAGECGMNSILMLLGILDDRVSRGEILSYEGPFGVGYGVVDLDITKDNSKLEEVRESLENRYRHMVDNESPLVALARNTINTYAITGEIYEPRDERLEEWIEERAGVFVSIKKNGELRGCIGTLASTTDNVIEEVSKNAIQAGFSDPRFSPIQADELRDLVISVDILGSPEPIVDKHTLDPERYGVIVKSGDRIGLLLPNLEGVTTVEQQLQIARQKAGIYDAEAYDIERFLVTRYK